MSRLKVKSKVSMLHTKLYNEGHWVYKIEKGNCMDYHVTAKCSNCGWNWYSADGIGNSSAVFGAFITNYASNKEQAEQFLLDNANKLNKFICCPCCGTIMKKVK